LLLFRWPSLLLAQFLDAPPVRTPLMRLRAPSRYDPALPLFPIGIDDCDLQSVHQADGIDAPLSVVEPIVYLLKRWAVEDAYGILEGDAVKPEIAAVLAVDPSVARVFTQRKYIFIECNIRSIDPRCGRQNGC